MQASWILVDCSSRLELVGLERALHRARVEGQAPGLPISFRQRLGTTAEVKPAYSHVSRDGI